VGRCADHSHPDQYGLPEWYPRPDNASVTHLDPVLGILGMLAVLIASGLYIGGAAWLAWWMLEPINRVAGHLQATTRYLLTDFLGLMVLLQAALAVVGRAIDTRPGGDRSPYWIVLSVALLLMLVLWAASVSVVSRAGIIRPWRRLAVMLLLVPGALAVIVGWPVALVAAIAYLRMFPGPSDAIPGLVLILLGSLALIAAPIGLRALSFWSLSGSPGGEALEAIMAYPAYPRPPLDAAARKEPGGRG